MRQKTLNDPEFDIKKSLDTLSNLFLHAWYLVKNNKA